MIELYFRPYQQPRQFRQKTAGIRHCPVELLNRSGTYPTVDANTLKEMYVGMRAAHKNSSYLAKIEQHLN
ncbi:MAG: hypothetical protein SPL35_02280, partial [Bacteroidales bacterium]|nr:hypothetical protein [Bacteroidales bacterium]